MSSLKEKSIKGLFWELGGRIGLQGVGFVVSIILARVLAPEDFGILAIITVFIELASVFLDFGFSTALIQRKEVTELHYASVFFLNVGMGFILALIVFLTAPFISSFYENSQLNALIRVMSLSFIVNSFGNVARAHLRREMNFKAISLAGIIASVISGAIAIYMALTGFGVWSLAIQSISNQMLGNIILYRLNPIHFKLKLCRDSIKELWPFSSRIFYSGFVDTLFSNFDSIIIGKILSPATLGYYSRAKSLQNFSFRYSASTIASVLLPGLSSIQNEPDRLRQTVLKIFHLLSFVSFLGCGILLVSGREIIILLFSEKWEPSVIMFQIIISGAFALQIFSLFHNTLLSTGNAKTFFNINMIYKALLFLNFSLLLIWGLNVYLIGINLISVILFYLGLSVVSKQLNFRSTLYYLSFRSILVFLISTGFTFSVKYYILTDNLLLNFFAGTFSYLLCFLALSRIFTPDGLKVFFNELTDLIKLISQKND
jgi:O-antigen/teichoic acid export membrane protein